MGITGKYLLTGATGFLGSHIMAELLTQDRQVIIAGRASKDESLEIRIKKLLRWFNIEQLNENLEMYETDFLEPRLGLDKNLYDTLGNQQMSIIHCASDTSFTESKRALVMKSNVESLYEILNFAIKSKAKHFYFISTAYAAGIDRDKCLEAPVQSKSFNNVYEESKAQAESIISQRCENAGISYSIIRPSVIYGDSVTGRALKFNAMYYPINFLRHIRDIYLNDIKNNNGIKSAECGIYINKSAKLHLPIKIFIPSAGKINFIPIDYFIDTFMSIADEAKKEKFYHITNSLPKTMAEMIEYTKRFLNITGVEVIVEQETNITRNPAEELFDHFIKAYLPYIADTRTFATNNTENATGAKSPHITYEIFHRCMTFAEQTNWGKNIL